MYIYLLGRFRGIVEDEQEAVAAAFVKYSLDRSVNG